MEAIRDDLIAKDIVKPVGIVQFFKVRSEGNSLVILDDNDTKKHQRFDFPRQV